MTLATTNSKELEHGVRMIKQIRDLDAENVKLRNQLAEAQKMVEFWKAMYGRVADENDNLKAEREAINNEWNEECLSFKHQIWLSGTKYGKKIRRV